MKLQIALLTVIISFNLTTSAQRTALHSLHNPVLNSDFPDPTVIKANGKYFAYGTQSSINGKILNIQVASSFNMQDWKMEGDALPQKPAWASTTQDFWAPHVLFDESLKKYVLFYSGESDDTTTGKCLGVAFSNSPEGPFTDKGTPLLCGQAFEDIDPMAFKDPKSGKKLLFWGSGFQPIKMQELTDDWKDFKPGTVPKEVVWPNKEKSYDNLIEGTWVTYHKGTYFLFFSGDNCCGANAHYAVMVAKSNNPFGPFIRLGESNKTGNSVILEKNDRWLAPGHNSIFKDERGNEWMAYHAIYIGDTNSHKVSKGRVLCIDPIRYKNGWPVVLRSK